MSAMYKSEKQFKDALVKYLKQQNYFVTPIQTKTHCGVPDLYVARKDWCGWIECKRMSGNIDVKSSRPVPIRFQPGQQLWAMGHYLYTGNPVLLAVAFDNICCGAYMRFTYITEHNIRAFDFSEIPNIFSF